MLHGKHSRRILPIAFALTLGACGSGGDSGHAGSGNNASGANTDATAPSNDNLVDGQANAYARFGQASFESASFVVEASSGRYGTDRFR